MDVKLLNISSATMETSYRPAQRRAKPGSEHEKLALVIPTLHEAANLGPLLCRLRSTLESIDMPWEIIVVDDESRDGTEEIVAAIAREDPRVRLLVRRGEFGLSGAVLQGWKHTGASILGAMDADGQHPPELLPVLLAEIGMGHGIAIGSRYAGPGRGGWNPVRRLISRAAIWVARPLQSMRLRVRDPLSGFFIVKRQCIENVAFQTSGFKLLLEILVRGRVDSVKEVPFAFGPRRAGRSKVTARVAWHYLTLLARLYRARFAMARVTQAASGD
jgi:dolichol-phosphate mannosyltransferase